MKHIVIVSHGRFPEGDAIAVRLKMTGKALIDAGYKVTVLCKGAPRDRGISEGIEYISLRYRVGNRLVRLWEYLSFKRRVFSFLKKNKENIHCIYLYCGGKSLYQYCKRLNEKNGIKLVRDCHDWFSPEDFRFGRLNFLYHKQNAINTKVTDRHFNIIAISRYFQKYYDEKGLKTVYVPVLCDSELRTSPKEENGEKLTLFYAGAPGKKDYVGNILRAAALLDKDEKKRLKVVFVGVTKDTLEKDCGLSAETLELCSELLEAHSRVPREKVLEMMERADFTVLPRAASALYAMAGFPSKVTESLANATPILCNISSDLGEFLVDGENAIIARDHSPEALAEAISRAIKLTPGEKNIMSQKALDTAAKFFDYRLYTDTLKEIIG